MKNGWTPPLRVAVLAGGDSAERDVSLASGRAVAAALRTLGYVVRTIDPRRVELDRIDWSEWDACFIALHGGAGEDGRVQRQLDARGVRYTGSGPETSRLAMSKSASKRRFIEAGVPTPTFVEVNARDATVDLTAITARIETVGFPLVIKPDGQGSSLGVALVDAADGIVDAVAAASRYGERLIAERRIVGRELTVAVVDRHPLPVLEIVAPGGFYNYRAKYHSPDTRYQFDTGLPPTVVERVARVAVAATEALGTAGLVRVDVMLDQDGQPWVLEVNTIPGMTSRSLAPRSALRAGRDMPELCDALVRNCLARGVANESSTDATRRTLEVTR